MVTIIKSKLDKSSMGPDGLQAAGTICPPSRGPGISGGVHGAGALSSISAQMGNRGQVLGRCLEGGASAAEMIPPRRWTSGRPPAPRESHGSVHALKLVVGQTQERDGGGEDFQEGPGERANSSPALNLHASRRIPGGLVAARHGDVWHS